MAFATERNSTEETEMLTTQDLYAMAEKCESDSPAYATYMLAIANIESTHRICDAIHDARPDSGV